MTEQISTGGCAPPVIIPSTSADRLAAVDLTRLDPIQLQQWACDAQRALRAQPLPRFAMVPERMFVEPEALAAIAFTCGGDENATDPEERWLGGWLWVGYLEEEDGTKRYGLHIACADYPEEGNATVVAFDPPVDTNGSPRMPDALEVMARQFEWWIQFAEQSCAQSGRTFDADSWHSPPEYPTRSVLEAWIQALRQPQPFEAGDGMLPDALLPHATEWYRLCERRFAVDRITISGKLAEAIVEAVGARARSGG